MILPSMIPPKPPNDCLLFFRVSLTQAPVYTRTHANLSTLQLHASSSARADVYRRGHYQVLVVVLAIPLVSCPLGACSPIYMYTIVH